MHARILIVDDEPNVVSSFASLLADEGLETASAGSAEEAERLCVASDFDLVLLDLQLPGRSGLDFLQSQKGNPTAPKILVISGQADIPAAIQAVRSGAIDFLEKPVPPEKLIASVGAALALAKAEKQRNMMIGVIDQNCQIVGQSRAIKNLLAMITQVAPTDATVLVTGENGTGKELIATRLFLESDRREAPYLKVNCPGIPETLFESELFGHVKGAFTGATRNHPGKFVQADSGTIFLDEIGDLPLPCQAKLLRVIETGEIETLGAENSRVVDVRVICATNQNLAALIAAGKFREDLYYRISVVTIESPPLARRTDDIPLLAGEFLKRFDPAGRMTFTPAAMAYLGTRRFPGNVRQLKNLIERLVILTPNATVDVPDIASHCSGATDESASGELTLADHLSHFERNMIRHTLSECQNNISEAARKLGIDRANLSRKVKEYDLKTNDQ